MRHDWIFDVLADLSAYADENDLPALADQVRTALAVAELEVGAGGAQTPNVVEAMLAERRRRTH